jgi:hypothetical protein
MPLERVLNSIALIKGSPVSEVLIKQMYSTLPELTNIFSLLTRSSLLIIMDFVYNIPIVSIEKLKVGNV